MRVGIDILGGDYMPKAPLEGAIRVYEKMDIPPELVLIGDQEIIRKELISQNYSPENFSIIHRDTYISMSEAPAKAMIKKPHSTIATGIQLLKTGEIDAFISAGNTGAVLVAAVLGLGTSPGITRPTIGTYVPRIDGKVSLMCDVGANVDCKAELLLQFAILGSAFMQNVQQVKNPKVALLNIGEEPSKGTKVAQETYELLSRSSQLNFIGNAEGRDLYQGKADVYVCDGFTGNLLLKFGESMYDILKEKLGEKDTFVQQLNFEKFGGVPILGIDGICLIGHGISTGKAFENMIYQAINAKQNQLVTKLAEAFQPSA